MSRLVSSITWCVLFLQNPHESVLNKKPCRLKLFPRLLVIARLTAGVAEALFATASPVLICVCYVVLSRTDAELPAQ